MEIGNQIDYLTKYCEVIPIYYQTTNIAKEFVIKIIIRHGFPRRLLIDQGRNFVSSLFYTSMHHIKYKETTNKTTPYHPQCNGLWERLHNTLNWYDITLHIKR